jgi:hypothetical protein
VKALPTTINGKRKLILVAFGADAKDRVASVLEISKAAEALQETLASNITDLKKSEP